VCFAGIGPGEVVTGDDKLVGISQRRSRAGARYQCAVHTTWSPQALVDLLLADIPVAELPPVATITQDVAAALPAAVATSLDAS
jgi:hypothetical protein